MSTSSIPPKNRDEWRKMIVGEIQHQYTNYVLQVQIHQLRKDIAGKNCSIEQAIDKLYALCTKYSLAVQPDFQFIFKNW